MAQTKSIYYICQIKIAYQLDVHTYKESFFIELLQAKNRKNEYKISKLFTEDALDSHVQISNDVHLAFEKFDARCRSL